MKLPIFQSPSTDLTLMQTSWASKLEPILSFPPASGIILKNIALVSGTTKVDHKLSRKLQGWHIVRQRASASIYDTQDSNSTPDITLQLVSSAAVTVDILVF